MALSTRIDWGAVQRQSLSFLGNSWLAESSCSFEAQFGVCPELARSSPKIPLAPLMFTSGCLTLICRSVRHQETASSSVMICLCHPKIEDYAAAVHLNSTHSLGARLRLAT